MPRRTAQPLRWLIGGAGVNRAHRSSPPTGPVEPQSENGGYNNNGSQGLVFYGRTGFRGASRVVSSGSTNVGWAARSIQVRDNRPWQVCDNTGECATVTGDVSDVSQLGLNGRITSVRPVNNNSRWRR